MTGSARTDSQSGYRVSSATTRVDADTVPDDSDPRADILSHAHIRAVQDSDLLAAVGLAMKSRWAEYAESQL